MLENEASWFPADLRELYTGVFTHLEQHWQRFLQPRFHPYTNLTLAHADAYFVNFLCPTSANNGPTYLLDWQSPSVDLGAYDLVALCAAFWTSEQRHEANREYTMLQRYYAVLQANGVTNYTWGDLVTDYRSGLIFWLLMPLQDRYDGASKAYWWPKMQCLVVAFREWDCETLLGLE